MLSISNQTLKCVLYTTARLDHGTKLPRYCIFSIAVCQDCWNPPETHRMMLAVSPDHKLSRTKYASVQQRPEIDFSSFVEDHFYKHCHQFRRLIVHERSWFWTFCRVYLTQCAQRSQEQRTFVCRTQSLVSYEAIKGIQSVFRICLERTQILWICPFLLSC